MAVLASDARAEPFRVVVVPGLEISDLDPLSRRGAVGLLVPGAGPKTSEAAARAGLERGKVENWLRAEIPAGPRKIRVETRRAAPRAGPAIVLALPRGGEQPNDRRYPIAVVGAGYDGVLTSESTRIPGLVTVADVAPTALRSDGALVSSPRDEPVATLERLDERIRENNGSRAVASLLTQGLLVALALVRPRAAVLGFATLLATNLALGALGISQPWLVLPALLASVGLGAPLLARAVRSAYGVGAVCAAVLGAYLAAFLVDGTWVALSPLGPTQNARFYGISNLLETLLLVPALVAAGALGRRPATFAALAALAFVLVAGSRFGADGGGAVVLGVAYAILAALLARAGRRTLALGAAAAVVLALGLIALDAATGGSSHVTRVITGGPGDVASALRDRVSLSFERATASWYTALVVAAGAAAIALLARRLVGLREPARRRALPGAFAAAVATSLVVNDSPVDVVVAGLVGYLALDAYALRDHGALAALTRRLAPARAPARAVSLRRHAPERLP